jgi:hypothetical protein
MRLERGSESATKEKRQRTDDLPRRMPARSWHAVTRHDHSGGVLGRYLSYQ